MLVRHGLLTCRCAVTSFKVSCRSPYPDFEHGSLDGQVPAKICGITQTKVHEA